MPGVPVEFLIFALMLAALALLQGRALEIAATGLAVLTAYTLAFGEFREGPGLSGLGAHLEHEWVMVFNLGALLLGFALLSRHFEESQAPKVLPRMLPQGIAGPFMLLMLVFVLSAFLDNIAAALIGGTMARSLFPSVHVGFLAAVVAASNAGGSGSVIGDTTTTMMWISGVAPADLFHAYYAAGPALLVSGLFAARQQHAHARMDRAALGSITIDWARVAVVIAVLLGAIATNVSVNQWFPSAAASFPFLGTALWIVLLVTALVRRPDWHALRAAARGAAFLVALVLSASLMPVDELPAPSWAATFRLGVVSSVFDNIPLTALAIAQDGYDWGLLAFAVGYGGSMIWFGSSAGVALSGMYPEARSVGSWIRHGWHVALAYVIGFFVLLLSRGWQPSMRAIP